MTKKSETWTLALCIALLPPIWAVAAPYLNVTTGAVALICAGLCAANGDRASDAVRISIGFLLGDFWAWLAVWIMDVFQSGTFLYLVRAGRSGGFVVRTGPQMDFLSSVALWLGHRTDYHGPGRILSGGYPASANRRCHVGGSMVRGSFLESCAQLDAPSGGEASEIRNGGIYHERKSWRESGRNGTALF